MRTSKKAERRTRCGCRGSEHRQAGSSVELLGSVVAAVSAGAVAVAGPAYAAVVEDVAAGVVMVLHKNHSFGIASGSARPCYWASWSVSEVLQHRERGC